MRNFSGMGACPLTRIPHPPGWSATLTQSGYFRVARHPERINWNQPAREFRLFTVNASGY